jgi:hypothetical protein
MNALFGNVPLLLLSLRASIALLFVSLVLGCAAYGGDGIPHGYATGTNSLGKHGMTDYIAVYTPGRATPLRIIKDPSDAGGQPYYPIRLAFDKSGYTLFVSNGCPESTACSGWVSVYAKDATEPLRRIINGIGGPTTLAFDAMDNLYVADTAVDGDSGSGAITVYESTTWTLLRTLAISKVFAGFATGMVFDPKGNLYAEALSCLT